MPKFPLRRAALVALGLAAAGCGDQPAPMPTPVIGNYTVTVEANGQTDSDQMYVTLGSEQNVLLTFLYGISEVRGTLADSTQLTLPRQTLHVAHSTGVFEGVAIGEGTFTVENDTATAVDFTLQLTTPGFGPSDGGSGLGGTGEVSYHVSGTRN